MGKGDDKNRRETWARGRQGCVLLAGREKGLGVESRRKGQVGEADPAQTTVLEEKPWDPQRERVGEGCALEEGAGGAALTGLMSRCRKPTEWMASMDSRICLPSRSVVLSVKVPRGWLRRRSARFRP